MKYTKENIERIEKYLLESKNVSQVSKELKIPDSTIRYFIKKFNLKVLKKFQRLNVKHDYFNIIDSELKAYILGYFFADGSIENRNGTKRIRFNSAIADIKILELIRNEISPETKMSFTLDKRNNLKINGNEVKTKQISVSFGIVSENIVSCINQKYNVSYDKTYSQNEFNFNEIPKKFYRDFIRGFFDGDGSVLKRIVFLSMNHVFLLQIKKILNENFNINSYFKTLPKRNNIGYLSTKEYKNFLSEIYYENCICLERKYNKFINE